ncbi:MAG: hypothetical protein NVS9B15_14210 [Acidobacteriaceae bacterium]
MLARNPVVEPADYSPMEPSKNSDLNNESQASVLRDGAGNPRAFQPQLSGACYLSPDFQFIRDPGYNADRGLRFLWVRLQLIADLAAE